jgi:acyl carrier protein
MNNPSATLDTVREIVLDILEMEPAELQDDTEFKSLDVNSLMALDILTGLERKFRVKFPEKTMRNFTSINAINEVVGTALLQKANEAAAVPA